jgi:hypothetical protein
MHQLDRGIGRRADDTEASGSARCNGSTTEGGTWMTTQDSQTRTVAGAVLAGVGVFPVIVVALNLVQRSDGYSVVRDAISNLALGQDGALMAVAFCSLGLGTLAFALLLHRTSGHALVRTGLLGVAGVLSFVSAAFHTDPSGVSATTHGTIHNTAGIATFVSMLLAMAISAARFRREPHWRRFTPVTAVCTVAGVVAFFLVPALGQAHFGVSQRLLVGAFLVWMLAGATHQLSRVGTTALSAHTPFDRRPEAASERPGQA